MSISFRIRQLQYDLDENLLVRPGAIALACGVVGIVVPWWEAGSGLELHDALARVLPTEASSAQVVLGTIAGALMTVVSVVYSILLVALSLASMQFSTRILTGFMRDRAAQGTLGLLVGAFIHAVLVLRSVRSDPPFVPVVALVLALVLALAALAALVWFIHHIVLGIQASTILDRLAASTEPVIDAVFGPRLADGEEPACARAPEPPPGATPVFATRSGYIQIYSVPDLLRAARGGRLVVLRGMGQFVAEGAILAAWAGPHPIDVAAVNAAFDLGSSRTMQDDVEHGFRQIVDVGLKAISPAVNDPSTGASAIDHLSRLCIRAAGRRSPPSRHEAADARVEVPTTHFVRLVDLAFSQMRQYARADMAVSLRILRALADIAEVTPHATGRAALLRQGALTYEQACAAFADADRHELAGRWARLQRAAGTPP